MKRILLLLVAITAFSCSSDDNSALSNLQSMSGDWKQIIVKADNESEEIDISNCNQSLFTKLYKFNTNGVVLYKNACDESQFEERGYSYTGDNLTISYGQTTLYYQVNFVDDNTMKLTLLQATIGGESQDYTEVGYYEIYQKQ